MAPLILSSACAASPSDVDRFEAERQRRHVVTPCAPIVVERTAPLLFSEPEKRAYASRTAVALGVAGVAFWVVAIQVRVVDRMVLKA